MNALLAIPVEARMLLLFLLGICVGALLNLGIYRLAWEPRAISPWLRKQQSADGHWSDWLPVVGWWGLRREARQHGRGFWLRPLLIELGTGVVFAGLYWWEIERQALLIPPVSAPLPPAPQLMWQLHAQYLSHVLLVSLMIVASFIDVDERIIPDTITVPGALLGMVFAVLVPGSLLPHVIPAGNGFFVEFVRLSSPNPWPAALASWPNGPALGVGLGCFLLWCVGLLPRQWRGRRGTVYALRLIWARITREPFSYLVLGISVIGAGGIAVVWWIGGERWEALLTALVGLAAAGGLVWSVRFIGTSVLKREAMGFGDVTLMSMIGTFLGWQACLMIFFLAPFFGLVVGALQWLFHRETEIYYGPFLCLAAFTVILYWGPIWDWALPMFAIGWLVPAAVIVCMVLMGLLLGAWQAVLNVFRGR